MMQLRKSVGVMVVGLVSFCASAQSVIAPPYMQPEWSKPYEPFRLVGNLYYVGTYDLASYLVTTPQGHILINTGLAESASMIRSNVEVLGFKFSDIKILLATHAHYDHVGAMATIKELTGATMMIMRGDSASLADGGNSDYIMGGKGSTFAPVKPDRLLYNNDTIRFGGMNIVALHHPGHTKGATSFLFDIKDEKATYRVLIANMPTILTGVNLSGMAAYPDVGKDFKKTLDQMKLLKFDLWFASHASQFELHRKHNPGDPYLPQAFRDQAGYDKAISDLERDYQKRMK